MWYYTKNTRKQNKKGNMTEGIQTSGNTVPNLWKWDMNIGKKREQNNIQMA
jgi:hypothetical protein